jgi:WD40 repeat protein
MASQDKWGNKFDNMLARLTDKANALNASSKLINDIKKNIQDIPKSKLENSDSMKFTSKAFNCFQNEADLLMSMSTPLAVGLSNGIDIISPFSGESYLKIPSRFTIQCLAISPDGRALASSSAEGTKIWDLTTGLCISELKLTDPEFIQKQKKHFHATSLSFSEDGSEIIVAFHRKFGRGKVHIFETKTWTCIRILESEKLLTPVQLIALSPGGNRIATVHNYGQKQYVADRVILWDYSTGKPLLTWDNLTHLLNGKPPFPVICFSPDGNMLAMYNNSMIHLLDAKTGESIRSIPDSSPSSDKVISMFFSIDGQAIALVGNGVQLLDIMTGEILERFEGENPNNAPYRCLAFSPDNHTLAFTHALPYQVIIFNYRKGIQLATVQYGGEVSPIIPTCIAYSPVLRFIDTRLDYLFEDLKRMLADEDFQISTENGMEFILSWL